MAEQNILRRPIKSRNTKWAMAIARWLASLGIRPNQISILSIIFAGASGFCLIIGMKSNFSWHMVLLISAAIFIQLRLLCNLFDGMIAVEGGLRTKSGEIFNELPDRLSDSIIFVCAGYSIMRPTWGFVLGWAVALLAVMTAYVRLLGSSSGAQSYFCGPMAKQHRMVVMMIASLLAALRANNVWGGYVIISALILILIGCIITIIIRTRRIIIELESK